MNTEIDKKDILFAIESSGVDKETKPGPTILVVGQVSRWRKSGRNLPADAQMVFAEFHELSTETLETVQPDIILSPLMCPAFDCLDLAVLLERLDFQGRYRVMAPALPKPKVILAEIALLCPRLDFSFIFSNEPNFARAN